jgi:N-acetyl-gamma-glutamyl-phosphate reductase common form
MKRIAIIGARGYVGAELLKLLARHSGFELAIVGSRALNGERVADHFEHASDLVIEDLTPEQAADRDVDAWVLGLPNGLSADWVEAIRGRDDDSVVVDLSSDHRFDDGWTYGLTERNRDAIRDARWIANPGCYATGAQLALAPIIELADGRPTVFGVSGYSGAGTTPSDKNDPENLRDNLLPYKLVNHTHEREVSRHLAHDVDFMPHVAPFFRGITLTITADVGATSTKALARRYATYTDEPLVEFVEEIPHVRDAAGRHAVHVGGLTYDPDRGRAVVVATLDNLLKGAATQALQNLNLMCGFDELEGIH